MTRQYDAFVSYTTQDREIVTGLVAALRRDGVNVWYDVKDMTVGVAVSIQLADAVDACRHVILCLSDAYLERKWPGFEVQVALDRDPSGRTSRTLPVVVRSLTDGLPPFLRHLATCDLTDPDQYPEQYARLIRELRSGAAAEPSTVDRDDVARTSAAAFEHLDDPALTLFQVRRATAGLTRLLYQERVGVPPAAATLDEMVESLLVSPGLPQDATAPLAQLHTFARAALRDEGAGAAVSRDMVAPAVNALRMLTDWLFPERRAQETWAEIWASLPMENSLSERRIPGTPYRLREPPLSRNSLGPLYGGVDTERGETVSVNLAAVPVDRENEFFEEVGRFRRLFAANIVSPRDAGRVTVDGERRCLYLVLPPLAGHGLRELVESNGPLPETAAYEVCLGVATALVGFHEAEPPMVHGDIKPASVVVSDFGTVGVLCIGHEVTSAPAAALSQNADGRIDSYPFAGPERRHGRPLTPATDLFGLRMLLVYLLTGSQPTPEAATEALVAGNGTARVVLERLAACGTALDACRVLSGAVREAAGGRAGEQAPLGGDLKSIMDAQRIVAPAPGPAPGTGQLRLVDVCPIAARQSWPLGDDTVLAWELSTGVLVALRGADLVWRDSEPLPVRRTAAGPDGRFAVGGWNGAVRCFTPGGRPVATSLDGAVGDLAYLGTDVVAGSWNRALRRIADDGAVHELLGVESGVHRIAVSERGSRYAVADLAGGLAFYAGDRRVETVPAAGPMADIAYAGARLVVLTHEAVSSVRLDGTMTDPVPTPGAFALGPDARRDCCLLLVSTDSDDPAGSTVQAWRVDEQDRRLASFTLAAGERLLSMSAAGNRLTVRRAAGGCAYRRDGAEAAAWPDALAAWVSGDGCRIVVSRPTRVEVYEDPA